MGIRMDVRPYVFEYDTATIHAAKISSCTQETGKYTACHDPSNASKILQLIKMPHRTFYSQMDVRLSNARVNAQPSVLCLEIFCRSLETSIAKACCLNAKLNAQLIKLV
jgi:hypothetical protein